jgi:hypothetical protein
MGSDTIFNVEGLVSTKATLDTGLVTVTAGQSLKIDISGFLYDIGGLRGAYSGAVAQSVTDDNTSYVYLDNTGTLQINTTGFPSNISFIRLARVMCANGEVGAIYNEKVLLAASSSVIGTCKISYPVDGDIRGGGTTASSNNDFAAIRFDYTADGWNRINRRPPQNYTSGDVIMRVIYSWPSTIGNNKETQWKLDYAFRDVGDALGTWDDNDTQQFNVEGQTLDTLYSFDLTIPSADFDKTKDLMFLKLTRLATDPGDDTDVYCYVHQQELIYTGYMLAGQAGQ